mmetsp:Transcript_20985/g.30075  ORF Transcript_20985/g.30075 Transcript_20985/m.30075 type:complete len:366 (-) Transcript_20985:144-1241(-)
MLGAKKTGQENDIKFPLVGANNPTDSISSICCNGFGNTATTMLMATSWDCTVTCFEIQSNSQGQVNIVNRGQIRHDAPVLCSDISTDNITAFSGGCDGAVKMWNVTQGPTAAQTIGTHEQPVKCLKYMADTKTLLTGSWDKTLKVWDLRQPTPAATIQLSERVYCMDTKGQAVVSVTADKQVSVFNITSGSKFSEFQSPLVYQPRCVSIFSNNLGFALGCIEGRIAIECFDELQYKKNQTGATLNKPKGSENFAFKCHRDQNDIFSVNAIAFHPKNTFCSAGSDGVLSFWDKEARYKLSNFDQFKRVCPITDVKFNEMGNYLFYSLSYDWSRGAENNEAKYGQNIYLHMVQPGEVTPKDKSLLKK